ncbi:hypothetical protein KTAU_33840 [Thermogemmatispora aurantia]|uniref:GAF domain-containing protein n=1 Tax=Thermogemmatispora aurantia TaxID=2045279 RepID=A0A5J4K817_9CHLR|nr:hypothetical protein [Thermogemmatispora aurantia]GER84748.1 hypothetical protein KTAU_33840 [Thermogemmatispora aurantia]
MYEPQRWNEFLSSIEDNPQEQMHLLEAAGISSTTLARWAAGEESPCPYALYRLFCALPHHHQGLLELVAQEFALLSRSDQSASLCSEAQEIAPVFYDRVLNAALRVPMPLRTWAISNLVLQQATIHLDPRRQGLSLIIVRCMPPSRDGYVRSLRTALVNDSRRWQLSSQSEACFYGSESLAGHAVSMARTVIFQVPARAPLRFPTPGLEPLVQDEALSAVACPIVRARRVAGCLLAVSSRLQLQAQEWLSLLHKYRNLLLLAFEPDEFYPIDLIRLYRLPPLEVQKPLLANLRRHVAQMMSEATRQHQPLDVSQAEALAWRQLEEELLAQVAPTSECDEL